MRIPLLVLIACLLAAACSGGSRPTFASELEDVELPAGAEPATGLDPTTEASEPEEITFVAHVRADLTELAVHDAPDGELLLTLDNPTSSGVNRVLMVLGTESSWHEVVVPGQPGQTGWIPDADVDVFSNPFSLELASSRLELIVRRDGDELARYPVGLGPDLPASEGPIAVSELLEAPADTADRYAGLVYVLSSGPEAAEAFETGGPLEAIHGATDEAVIGSATAPTGSVQLRTEDIQALVGHGLPLGTPLAIS